MLTYILQIIIFQVLFLAVYDFFLSKETFHTSNRWYLLGTPILSFVLPLIKIPTFQKAMPQEIMILLPEVMLSPQKVIEQTTFYTDGSINYLTLLFWAGVSLFTVVFLIKLFRIIQLITKNVAIKKHFYKLILLPKENSAFSFFNYIFLGQNISKEKQEAIIEHELIHATEKHSLDLLFFELLKIVMWFNPMIYFYQKRITLLHEYISDAAIIKNTQKHHYFNTLLSQTFQVENISFVNQFYKHSLIKKRIIMMTKNKSKKMNQLKYLFLIPVLFSMIFYASCVGNEDTKELIEIVEDDSSKIIKQDKTYDVEEIVEIEEVEVVLHDVPFATIEEVPVFPGCTGTRKEKADCLNSGIQKFVVRNFNGDLAGNLGLPKGKKRIWVVFRIDEKGNVTEIKARAPHPKLQEEAERVAALLPKMKAGRQRGEAVGMKYTLPISFNVE